jgi:RimJ/RimL family protein N-acetyltransferase
MLQRNARARPWRRKIGVTGTDGRVRLRPVEECDFDHLVSWESDPTVDIQFGKTFSSLASYTRYRHLLVRGHRYGMAIVLGPDRLVGYVELVNLAWRARTGELCMLIGEESDRGQGYGTLALRQFLQTAFERLGLERVFLRVGETNVRARRCYGRCGFRTRARLEITARQPDRTEPLLLMDLDRGRWVALTGAVYDLTAAQALPHV